ncbi:MAG: ABC transporter ATP-binding protein, partial [Proteiniclasticum sp.]|nr:ABC transporter ATP-binding protein [Proteiniclasticum sp.]
SSLLELDLSKKIEDLSYGNRKKVGIVQGLLHDPDLIILDEPTGGLDPLIQQKFFALLQEENSKGKTIFFSSHILSEVQRLCHRVAIIKEGKILKVSTMKSLREENYKKITVETKDSSRELFMHLPGVKDLSEKEQELKFIYKGNLKEILSLLQHLDLQNLLIEEPSLEEIFLHYYEKEEM